MILLAAASWFWVRSFPHPGKHLHGEGLRLETGPLWVLKTPGQQAYWGWKKRKEKKKKKKPYNPSDTGLASWEGARLEQPHGLG